MKHCSNIIKRYFILFHLACVTILAYAGKITVQAPSQVTLGEQFQLRYVINTTDVENFRLNNVPDAFEVLMGPRVSTQQSFSMINGKTTHSSTATYTYVLMANKNGTFVIPAARAVVDGEVTTSQAIKISVSGSSGANNGAGSGQSRNPSRMDRAGSSISSKDLFITATASKKRVYEQEPILLTYKVYTLVELTHLDGKIPDLNGFHTQEIALPQQKTFHVEHINGRPYNCVTWSQYVMYPQLTGKLDIPSITFNGIVVQQNPNVNPLEAFFNGGSGYIEVKKQIKAPAVSIQVDPLPEKPANYSGGVGAFTIKASVDKNTVKAGDPVNVRVQITGTGNMKLLKQPELVLPKSFDKYDAKVTDKTSLTSEGLSGSMIYDILIVPRNMGKYEIPPIEFVYFDTKTKSYKTLKTEAMPLQVEKGNTNTVTNYSTVDANDIRDLKVIKTIADDSADTFFASGTYCIINAFIILLFIALLVVFRKRAMMLADTVAMREKKANKVAVNRLKKAMRLMQQSKETEFYDEVMRALWGYVGDKLNMPAEMLSRDNIAEKLKQRNIDAQIVALFVEAIEECEFARFAPGDAKGNMQKTYEKASEAITTIERNIQ